MSGAPQPLDGEPIPCTCPGGCCLTWLLLLPSPLLLPLLPAAGSLPKHLLWLVARSMNTLEEMMLPKGRNICISSLSPNS